MDVCVALVKIKFQKNNIGVISVFGISLVFQNTIWYLVFQILKCEYFAHLCLSSVTRPLSDQMWITQLPANTPHLPFLRISIR